MGTRITGMVRVNTTGARPSVGHPDVGTQAQYGTGGVRSWYRIWLLPKTVKHRPLFGREFSIVVFARSAVDLVRQLVTISLI